MLGASARFRDTLAGRKRTVRLLPVLHRELPAFGISSLDRRLLHGGLPEQLTALGLPSRDFSEWTEAFWARDILELFKVGKRYSFLRFLELLWGQSGGLCELTKFTAACEASRQTLAFATLHPKAAFWLVAEDRRLWTRRRHGPLDVVECGPEHLPELMQMHRRPRR